MALIPLTGHTRGHAGVAVRGDAGWLLHAGDAFFHRREIAWTHRWCPPALRLFQAAIADDGDARRANRERLRELARTQEGARVFCAHDPVMFERLAGATLRPGVGR